LCASRDPLVCLQGSACVPPGIRLCASRDPLVCLRGSACVPPGIRLCASRDPLVWVLRPPDLRRSPPSYSPLRSFFLLQGACEVVPASTFSTRMISNWTEVLAFTSSTRMFTTWTEITCHSKRVTCHSKRVTCHSKRVTCHSKRVTCHSKTVTCQDLSLFKNIKSDRLAPPLYLSR
jgi:hypothetical protein